jgi:hypothetical protein
MPLDEKCQEYASRIRGSSIQVCGNCGLIWGDGPHPNARGVLVDGKPKNEEITRFAVIKYFDDHRDGIIGTYETIEEAKKVKKEDVERYKNFPYTSIEIQEIKK